MKNIKILGHQGDVVIFEIDEFPEGARIRDEQTKEVTIAYGEVTGHAHYFEDPTTVDLFKIDKSEFNGLCFFEVSKENQLIHGRARNFGGIEPDQDYHNKVEFKPGQKIMTGIVTETDWVTKTIRKVVD